VKGVLRNCVASMYWSPFCRSLWAGFPLPLCSYVQDTSLFRANGSCHPPFVPFASLSPDCPSSALLPLRSSFSCRLRYYTKLPQPSPHAPPCRLQQIHPSITTPCLFNLTEYFSALLRSELLRLAPALPLFRGFARNARLAPFFFFQKTP